MDCRIPGFPVLHYVLVLAQTHVHLIGDTMQSSHTLSPPCLLPSIFPRTRIFFNERIFASGGQSTGASASASVLPMNIQGLFPFDLLVVQTALKVFASTTVQKHQFFGAQPP